MAKNVQEVQELTPLQEKVHVLNDRGDRLPDVDVIDIANYLTDAAIKPENEKEIVTIANGFQLLHKLSLSRSMNFKMEMAARMQILEYSLEMKRIADEEAKKLAEEAVVAENELTGGSKKEFVGEIKDKKDLKTAEGEPTDEKLLLAQEAEFIENKLMELAVNEWGQLEEGKPLLEEMKYSRLEMMWRHHLSASRVKPSVPIAV